MRRFLLKAKTLVRVYTLRPASLLSLACCALCAAAHAAPITGQISISGYVAPVGGSGFGSATGLDFLKGPSITSSPGVAGGLTSYGAGSGSFAGFACSNGNGGCGSIQDILSFTTPSSAGFLSLATGTSTTLSFDLSSIASLVRGNDSTGGTLTLTGTGTIHETGQADTAGTITLTAQGNGASIFAGTLQATPVAVTPEPSSLALLGTGVLGIGGVMRRRLAGAA